MPSASQLESGQIIQPIPCTSQEVPVEFSEGDSIEIVEVLVCS